MIKLEAKLIELGYDIYFKNMPSFYTTAKKEIKGYIIEFTLNKKCNKINTFELHDDRVGISITERKQLDRLVKDLSQAYTEMQKDLEVLKEYENK